MPAHTARGCGTTARTGAAGAAAEALAAASARSVTKATGPASARNGHAVAPRPLIRRRKSHQHPTESQAQEHSVVSGSNKDDESNSATKDEAPVTTTTATATLVAAAGPAAPHQEQPAPLSRDTAPHLIPSTRMKRSQLKPVSSRGPHQTIRPAGSNTAAATSTTAGATVEQEERCSPQRGHRRPSPLPAPSSHAAARILSELDSRRKRSSSNRRVSKESGGHGARHEEDTLSRQKQKNDSDGVGGAPQSSDTAAATPAPSNGPKVAVTQKQVIIGKGEPDPHPLHSSQQRMLRVRDTGTDLADGEATPCCAVPVLSEELLRHLTGCDDLSLLVSTELRLDAEHLAGVDRLSQLAPQLSSLKLNHSHVPQVRLLGTRFTHLRYLWLNSSGVSSLRGLGACAPRVSELYVAFNYISDLAPLLDLAGTLKVVDVEGNQVSDTAMLAFVLPALSHVTSIVLQGNPVYYEAIAGSRRGSASSVSRRQCPLSGCRSRESEASAGAEPALPSGGAHGLRAWIASLPPQLQLLDDTPVQEIVQSAAAAAASTAVECGEGGQDVHLSPTACRKEAKITSEEALGFAAQPQHQATPVAVGKAARGSYVDPMDAALAEELRLVAECARECGGGQDALTDAVEAQNSVLYSRPSTSCSGSRVRRHSSNSGSAAVGAVLLFRKGSAVAASAAAPGQSTASPLAAPRPQTRLGSGLVGRPTSAVAAIAPQRLSSATSAATHSALSSLRGVGGADGGSAGPVRSLDASSLTTGSAFAGSAVSNLRRRQSPLPPRAANGIDELSGSVDGSTDPLVAGIAPCSKSATGAGADHPTHHVRGVDDSLDHLQSDDEEEDVEEEWERYKASLLRQHLQETSASFASSQYRQRYRDWFGGDGHTPTADGCEENGDDDDDRAPHDGTPEENEDGMVRSPPPTVTTVKVTPPLHVSSEACARLSADEEEQARSLPVAEAGMPCGGIQQPLTATSTLTGTMTAARLSSALTAHAVTPLSPAARFMMLHSATGSVATTSGGGNSSSTGRKCVAADMRSSASSGTLLLPLTPGEVSSTYDRLSRSSCRVPSGGRPGYKHSGDNAALCNDDSDDAENVRRAEEDEAFDAVVRREVLRTRNRIARSGQTLLLLSSATGLPVEESATARSFLEKQELFEVVDFELMPQEDVL